MDARPVSRRRLLAAVVILASCIGCDQATKSIAARELIDAEPRTYFGGVLRLQYALNPGGFLSLGHNLPKPVRDGIFTGFGIGLMALLTGYLVAKRNASPAVFGAIALMLAGGIGNLIDRMFRDGLVTDFMSVGIGPLRTGIFNVADMAIMAGAAGAIFLSLRGDAGNDFEPAAAQS